MTQASTAAHNVLEDLQMLEAGTWVPDEGSLGDSIANAEFVYERLKKYEAALRKIDALPTTAKFYTAWHIAFKALDD